MALRPGIASIDGCKCATPHLCSEPSQTASIQAVRYGTSDVYDILVYLIITSLVSRLYM